MVGNGSCLPVTSVGNAGTHGPFRLPNVLVAPNMIHNLLSIRHFTTDNSCSVEFDSSALTVRDLASRRPLLRCDSLGPLYTLRLPSSAAPISTSLPSPPPLLPPLGTTSRPLLNLVIVQTSLALRLLMSVSATRASWVATISGYKYYLVVLDDFSHCSWTFPLRAKSEAFSTLSHFFA
ncbi:hypothetical protein U9M48_023558 [Paspalum notatum var. saurae]|uniref:Uncharacterized protein n=1 Tax=Paspalum notatum var. saurae TaxID=547442 RepID=A0AAQ3TLT5_PASNO